MNEPGRVRWQATRGIGPRPRELGGALFLTRLFSSFLFEVTPLALLVLDAAAIVATWLPARRATRIDPTIALRAE